MSGCAIRICRWKRCPRRRSVRAPPPTYDREVRNAPPVRAAPPVPSNEVCELIDREVAMEVAPNREALKMALKGIEVSTPGIL